LTLFLTARRQLSAEQARLSSVTSSGAGVGCGIARAGFRVTTSRVSVKKTRARKFIMTQGIVLLEMSWSVQGSQRMRGSHIFHQHHGRDCPTEEGANFPLARNLNQQPCPGSCILSILIRLVNNYIYAACLDAKVSPCSKAAATWRRRFLRHGAASTSNS
jgi:hypothetical protein